MKVFEIGEKITSPLRTETELDDILSYLRGLPGLKGKFDHLNRNLTKKLIDCLEVKFYSKGEYLFKKGEKPDYAYVILYGQIILLDVKQTSYMAG